LFEKRGHFSIFASSGKRKESVSDNQKVVRAPKFMLGWRGLDIFVPLRSLQGQTGEATQAFQLTAGISGGFFIADKAYDWKELEEEITKRGTEFVVPPRSNRKEKRDYDKHIYKERNLIERFFCFMKNSRRLATKYDKTKVAYAAFVTLIGIVDWVK
jgi:putative transposase